MNKIFLFFLLLYAHISCFVKTGGSPLIECPHKQKEEYTMRVFIHPYGIKSESYFIDVINLETIEVVFCSFDLENDSVRKKEIYNSKLSEIEINDRELIKRKIEELQKMNEVSTQKIKKGGWLVQIFLKNKKYEFYYGEKDILPANDLLKKLIEISPIKIDLHGWS